MPILIVAIALLGLAVGSFISVLVERVPRRISIVRPGSRCPDCGHAIRYRHNIPVLGWLSLRGRCADCHARISFRYPVTEALTAVLFVAVTLRVLGLGIGPALPAFLCFATIGVALSLIDLELGRLPDALVLPAYPLVFLLLAGAALGQRDPAALLRVVVGAAALYGTFYALLVVHPRGIGFGDVKLAGLVGGVLGYLSYGALLVGAFAAFLLGAVVGIVIIATGRGTRRSGVPFGPFMVTGALVALFASGPILSSYLSVVRI